MEIRNDSGNGHTLERRGVYARENHGITCVLMYVECDLLHSRDFLLLVAYYRRHLCVTKKFRNKLSLIVDQCAQNIGTLRSAHTTRPPLRRTLAGRRETRDSPKNIRGLETERANKKNAQCNRRTVKQILRNFARR